MDEGSRRAGDGVWGHWALGVLGLSRGPAGLPSPPHCVGFYNPRPQEVVMRERQIGTFPGGWGGTLVRRARRAGFPLILAPCPCAKSQAFPLEQQLAPASPAPSRDCRGRPPRPGEPLPLPSPCVQPGEEGATQALRLCQNPAGEGCVARAGAPLGRLCARWSLDV